MELIKRIRISTLLTGISMQLLTMMSHHSIILSITLPFKYIAIATIFERDELV